MVNPQLENGHLKIANEIWDALCRIRIRGEARQVLDFIIRKTYGYNKTWDRISLSQFINGTGVCKQNICRSLKFLLKMNLIIKKDNDSGSIYKFNKNIDEWKPLSKKITLSKKIILSKVITPVIKKDNDSLSKKRHTKDIIQKTILQKTGKLAVKEQFDWINEYFIDYFNSDSFGKKFPYINDPIDFRTELQGFLRRTAGIKDILKAVNGCADQYNQKKEIQITGGD